VSQQHKRPLMTKPVSYDDALITSIIRYGESDCIVRLFSKINGSMRAFYRSGLRGKKSGAIEAPALAKIGFIEAEHKLDRLVTCDLDPIYAAMPLLLKAFAYRAYIAELIERFLLERDPAPEIFFLVQEAYLNLIESAKPSLLRAFELKLLDHCGFLPEVPMESEERDIVAFDPVSSHFLSKATDQSFTFSYTALLLLKSMLIAKLGSVNYEEADELKMIGRIFQSRLKLMGFAPLKSALFLKQLSGRSQ
jgi:DNA repair protein RecO